MGAVVLSWRVFHILFMPPACAWTRYIGHWCYNACFVCCCIHSTLLIYLFIFIFFYFCLCWRRFVHQLSMYSYSTDILSKNKIEIRIIKVFWNSCFHSSYIKNLLYKYTMQPNPLHSANLLCRWIYVTPMSMWCDVHTILGSFVLCLSASLSFYVCFMSKKRLFSYLLDEKKMKYMLYQLGEVLNELITFQDFTADELQC